MEERNKLKLQILNLIKKEIDECRAKSGLIVDRIDSEALIKVYNDILKL